MKNENTIRIGDWVRIREPNIFDRCGYPFSFEMAMTEIYEKHGKLIEDLLEKAVLATRASFELREVFSNSENLKSPVFHEIQKKMAYALVEQKKFGGPERKVHTKYIEDLKGLVTKVGYIRFVHSGKYFPSSGGYDCYSGEYDYEPGGLSERKVHKILVLDKMIDTNIMDSRKRFADENYYKIEACWVEKIKETK